MYRYLPLQKYGVPVRITPAVVFRRSNWDGPNQNTLGAF